MTEVGDDEEIPNLGPNFRSLGQDFLSPVTKSKSWLMIVT